MKVGYIIVFFCRYIEDFNKEFYVLEVIKIVFEIIWHKGWKNKSQMLSNGCIF